MILVLMVFCNRAHLMDKERGWLACFTGFLGIFSTLRYGENVLVQEEFAWIVINHDRKALK
jgi:hypothetical protein